MQGDDIYQPLYRLSLSDLHLQSEGYCLLFSVLIEKQALINQLIWASKDKMPSLKYY